MSKEIKLVNGGTIRLKEEKTYPWDKRPEAPKVKEPIPEELEFKRMVRSERKRIKKLKHAGVRDYLEERYS